MAHPRLVRTAYGISWAYLIGDVAHESYKAYCQNQRIKYPDIPREASVDRYNNAEDTSLTCGEDVGLKLPGKVSPLEDYRTVAVQRAVFQSVASMGLPAFTIHSIVRYSGRALKDVKNARLRTYGPISLGLAAVPFLPFIFDKPVEGAVEWTFHKAFETFGGKEAVGTSPSTGREHGLATESRNIKNKEKEL